MFGATLLLLLSGGTAVPRTIQLDRARLQAGAVGDATLRTGEIRDPQLKTGRIGDLRLE
jgi:hypothetical protein